MSICASAYIGRFAPSPSGALHFGSLLAALASLLDARAHQGRWLLRMEDLDPAREPEGAADEILRLLDALQLHWDGEVLYQSARVQAYEEALHVLRDQSLAYRCQCSRARIRALGGIYDRHCWQRHISPARNTAIRLHVPATSVTISDRIQGCYGQNLSADCGDFIIRRKDGLFAYQLAVVVDDHYQGITDVIRGHDLLDSTPRQHYLQQCLGLPHPHWAHIPVAANELGQKLSKQHFAAPLDPAHASEHIYQALRFLGQQPPTDLRHEYPAVQLQWAILHWHLEQVPATAAMPFKER